MPQINYLSEGGESSLGGLFMNKYLAKAKAGETFDLSALRHLIRVPGCPGIKMLKLDVQVQQFSAIELAGLLTKGEARLLLVASAEPKPAAQLATLAGAKYSGYWKRIALMLAMLGLFHWSVDDSGFLEFSISELGEHVADLAFESGAAA